MNILEFLKNTVGIEYAIVTFVSIFTRYISALFLTISLASCSSGGVQELFTSPITNKTENTETPIFKGENLIEILQPSTDDTIMQNQMFLFEAAVTDNFYDSIDVEYVQFEISDGTQTSVLGYKSTPNFVIPVTLSESGNRSFRVVAKLSDGSSIVDEVTLFVNAPNIVNTAPVANNDMFSIAQDTQLSTSTNSILANDTDAQNDMLVVANVGNSVNGTVVKNGNTINFTPTAGFYGNASFDYTVSDGMLTDSGRVNITVSQVIQNQAPNANNDSYSVNQNTPLTIPVSSLLSNDMDPNGDSITVTQVSNPVNGTVVKIGNNVTFTPTNGFFGNASFRYTISDGSLTDNATVNITVNQVVQNQSPNAVNDSYTTNKNTPLIRNSGMGLLANDTDPENSMITVVSTTTPSSGTISFNSNGSFTYTPVNNFTGNVTFQYTISDGMATDTATVTITVNNVSPIALGCDTQIPILNSTPSSRVSVSLCANVQNSPAQITLQWANVMGVNRNSVTINRRVYGASSWGSTYATANASGNTWTDTNVSVDTRYEYRVRMTTSVGEANGYIVSGINVSGKTYEGKVILVIDNTFQSTLASKIQTLQNNLRGKGWIPKTIYVSRTASVQTVKSQIQGLYNTDPSNTKAVFLLGHVPVPYSGTNNWPDGHSDHKGAWASDGYYGDMDGTWNAGGGNVWYYAHGPNSNSKFNNTTFPSEVELGVGRVDMYNLSGTLNDPFGNPRNLFSRSETQLLSDYLDRLSNFKSGNLVPSRKAIIDSDIDADGYTSVPSSYSTFSTSIDPSNIDYISPGSSPNFIGQINNDDYLWGHATGYATGIGMITNGNLIDSSDANIGSVFNMTFGSYFGDFDAPLNFLRGLLANDTGHTSIALTNMYSGFKYFYGHQMAMGENIGYAWKKSATNTDANYKPYRDYSYPGLWDGETFFSLMGDPTLTLFHPKGPSNISINQGSGSFTLSWTAPSGGSDGYYVYEIVENTSTNASGSSSVSNSSESISRIGGKIMATSTTISGSASGRKFIVRAIRDEVTASGSYENLSLGANN